MSQTWWHMTVISALEWLRQDDCWVHCRTGLHRKTVLRKKWLLYRSHTQEEVCTSKAASIRIWAHVKFATLCLCLSSHLESIYALIQHLPGRWTWFSIMWRAELQFYYCQFLIPYMLVYMYMYIFLKHNLPVVMLRQSNLIYNSLAFMLGDICN